MIVQKCGILAAETENKPLPKRAPPSINIPGKFDLNFLFACGKNIYHCPFVVNVMMKYASHPVTGSRKNMRHPTVTINCGHTIKRVAVLPRSSDPTYSVSGLQHIVFHIEKSPFYRFHSSPDSLRQIRIPSSQSSITYINRVFMSVIS